MSPQAVGVEFAGPLLAGWDRKPGTCGPRAARLALIYWKQAQAMEGSMQEEIYREIATAIGRGEPVVLATVARTRGSTPRKTGAKMVVRKDGTFFGTIGGGCGEAEVWQEAMDIMQGGTARIVTVDLTEPTDGEDKICGGVMDVFVERLA